MKDKIVNFYKRLKKVITKPVMKILPGQLAFFLVLSIIPLVYLVGIIASMFSLSVDSFVEFIKSSFPATTSSLLVPLISGKGVDFSVLFFVFSALILASNGSYSIIITSNILYGIEGNDYIKRRIKAFILTFIILILLGFIIIVPAFGNLILESIKNTKNVRPIFEQAIIIYRIIKIPLSFIFIYFTIKLIYTIAPDKNIKSRDCTYGSVFTTVGWIIATEIYSYYTVNFTNYDIFYGSLANLVVLLLWIFLLSQIFVIGMALNASSHDREEKDELKTLNK